MKKVFLLYAMLLAVLSVVTACSKVGEIVITKTDYKTDIHLYSVIKDDSIHHDLDILSSIITENASIISKSYFLSSDSIFKGGGNFIITGGDGLSWYFRVFGFDFYFIPGHIINIIGEERFNDWINGFEVISLYGYRDPREASMRTMIEDFGISEIDIITAQENALGMTMIEIDSLVTWARNVEMPPVVWDDETRKAFRWRDGVMSMSDIQALLSNDVNEIWAAFPGYGILHNGRVYSPEWLFSNTERAIYGELIPLSDLESVVYNAINNFGFIGEITDIAMHTLQTAQQTLHSPTPHQLTFNLTTGVNTTNPTPNLITPVTLNAWDVIANSLSIEGMSIYSETHDNAPVMRGYNFIGWYLDQNFTTPLTPTFRMPPRNVTLYAKWEVDPTPQPQYFTIKFNMNTWGWDATIPAYINPILVQEGTAILHASNLPSQEPSRLGYMFMGWSKSGLQGSWWSPPVIGTNDRMPSHDLTLYAVWEQRFGIWEPFKDTAEPYEVNETNVEYKGYEEYS